MMKKRQEPERPYFEIDENGKVRALPMKLPEILCPNKSSETKKGRRNTNFVLERMVLTKADFEEIPAKKIKKTEHNVRKELFKPPPTKNLRNRKTLSKPPIISKNERQIIPKMVVDTSPLVQIDEAERIISKPSVLKDTFFNVNSSKKNDNTTKSTTNSTEIDNVFENTDTKLTPSTEELPVLRKDSSDDFLEMEKICELKQSPLSSVCNLLENTKLNSAKKTQTNEDTIAKIRKYIEIDQKEFEEYKLKRGERMKIISDLLLILTDQGKENLNGTRRSGRLAKKLMISPVISKSVDLRKSTLKKNLSKNLESEIKSPGIRRTVEMYNSFRFDHTILCTPKIDRNLLNSPNSKSKLSRQLQNQCLMLQDTPVPKDN